MSDDDPNLITTPLEKTTSLDEEPKQPSNLPNALDHALRSIDLNSNNIHNNAAAKFTSKDVKYLFSGAPHFMLEKGRHNHWYPHAIFPWDVGAVSIQDFWDREALRHEAFTLGTLHAHLPVPGVHTPEDQEAESEEKEKEKGAKRSTFDLGIFEVPNMLSMNGKERGAVGVRHFLELPIADERRYHAPQKTGGDGVDVKALNNMPLTQAFETLGHMRDAYSECNQDVVLDRRRLLSQGPEEWKRIGVRDIQAKSIIDRLIVLSEFRKQALEKNKNVTILDRESVATLHEQLYTHVLYPPPKLWGQHHGKKQDEENLKCQIEVLTKVLAVKGAWLDFSLPDSRLRVGQVLWEMPADNSSASQNDHPSRKNDAERKWLLLQLLLAGELLVRLDAIVRLAVLKPSKNISVSSQDVRELDKLRHGKVNWDVLFVQRFMDNLSLKYCPSPATSSSSPPPPQEKPKRGLLARLGRRQSQRKSSQSAADSDLGSAWDCIITPRHAERQLQGLSVFAAAIDWPNRDTVINQIRAHLDKDTYNTPLTSNQQQNHREPSAHQYLIPLHHNQPPSSSGWLSRAWLTGLVLPGDSINALLMASILENDTSALSAIGSLANLRGGFSYMGASWWSTKSIAGRVLAAADESKVCMGWVRVSQIPKNQTSGEKLVDTWFSVAVREVERKKGWSPRIRQGVKLAVESHPLGNGEVVSGSTFTIPVDQQQQHKFAVRIDSFDLDISEASESTMVTAKQASISFSLTEETAANPISLRLPLAYNIHFISSFPCRPPRGSVHQTSSPASSDTDTAANHHHNLPGHPLHTSYSYKHIPLSSLRADTCPPERKSKQDAEPVWILDARGSRDHEVFARAWCAAVGVDAVVGRVGRSCLACCVREARAVDVPVVIRVK